MTDLTAEKIHLALLAVEAMRLSGLIPAGAEVSQRQLERVSRDLGCPVSARDIARFESRALHKAKLAALALQARSAS